MPNAAAVIGLSFEGTDLQQDPIGIFLELVDGGPFQTSEVRGEDVVIPSRLGQDPMARIGHQRRITLRGMVGGFGVDAEGERVSFETLALSIADLFDPTIVGTLTATLASGATATIEARPLSPLAWDPVILSVVERLQVELLSVDPDWLVMPVGS